MARVYGNTTNYGQKVGILMLDTHFPRVPGDIGNATTFPFPVAFKVVKEANAQSVVLKQDPALIQPFVKAAQELEAEGCKCIVTSCGFMAIFHKEIAAAVSVPVISSSLLQAKLVSAMLAPGKKVGIITAKASSLGEKHFAGVGIQDVDKVVYGVENTEFGQTFFQGYDYIDISLAQEEMVKLAKRMLEEHPDIGAFVLECTNMPPFTKAIQEATNLPVFDVINLICYVHKEAIKNTYFKKGEKVLNMNYAAVDAGLQSLVKVKVPEAWKSLTDTAARTADTALPAYIRDIMIPVNSQAGDSIPVSKFMPLADGVSPVETSKYEKRGIAVTVPQWNLDNCIGCNLCSTVCPHGAIRPFLFTAEEAQKAPAGCATKKANGKGMESYTFRIQVDPLDCQGCASCVSACPAKEKSLVMQPLDGQLAEQKNWDYCLRLPEKANPMDKFSVRGSQFQRPLMEFSGACPGCGESPYMKLITQLFGDHMYIANATGCAQATFLSVPAFPFARDTASHGPAVSNSLFENNAEFSLGMCLSVGQQRVQMKEHAAAAAASTADPALKAALQAWLDGGDDTARTRQASDALASALKSTKEVSEDIRFLRSNTDQLVKKSMWMYGGDGWAYDIGYGGLDHVLASGIDVNIFVVDTEVYSNTGGQSSKATSIGAVAQFAAGGKNTPKKDLGVMAMSYGYVYVAQVAMGASPAQLLTALKEAEAHKGPSLVIAYAPCINHGIVAGMGKSQQEQKAAVECGYWPLYRYNPDVPEGKNPFTLDSKEPNGKLRDFMMGEVRFSALTRTFPQTAEKLFAEAEVLCAQRYDKYKKMASGC